MKVYCAETGKWIYNHLKEKLIDLYSVRIGKRLSGTNRNKWYN
nr:MAG TPA: hypothetical protein [Caudoviricetes sp.]